jgi:UDP-glucose-4-epimerase GalE
MGHHSMITPMADSSNKNILVTGGAGYVGSHCAKALAQAGYTPVVFDNFSTGHRDFVRWGPVIEGDVRDATVLTAAIKSTNPAAVMHFAALSLVGQSVEQPSLYEDVNCGGTKNLLAAMVACDVRVLVFSSTAAIFGEPDTDLIDETTAQLPTSPYGKTKLACEEMIRAAESNDGLRSACLRYFNAAGADPDMEVGEDHANETHLIPLILDVALGRRKNVHVFGDDYETADGTAVRDYVHVTDLARAHLLALDDLLAAGQSMALNLGSGQGASVRQVLDAATRITDHRITTVDAPRRTGDPTRLVADPRAAQTRLEWQTRRSDIDNILTDAWAWHQKRFAPGLP